MSKPLKWSRGKSRILARPPVPQQPRKIRLRATVGERQIEVTRRGDAMLLQLLASAQGEWIEPRAVGAHGTMLTRHARLLRSELALPIESECVQYGSRFYNRHRLKAPIVIDGGENV